jgi:hypothetical protein
MVRTSLPSQFEHFIACTGSAAIAIAGNALSRTGMRIIGATMFGVGLSGGIEKTSLISVMSEERRARPHMVRTATDGRTVAGRDAMPRNCET